MATKEPPVNRRRSARHVVVCPVHLSTAERRNRLGITRDLSRSGTCVLSNSKFDIGQTLQVSLYTDGDVDATQVIDGKIVRIEALEAGLQWRYAMAVTFSRPLTTGEEEVLAERD